MKVAGIIGIVVLAGLTAARADREFIWGVSGVAGAPSNLYAINPLTGESLGKIGSTGAGNLSGLELKNGTLFAVQGQLTPTALSPKHLFQINKATGAATVIATLDQKYAISDLAKRPSDGVLFGFAIADAVKKLITIDSSTGAIVEIGAANMIQNVSLTFGPDGTLYRVRTNGLFTIDPATGGVLTGPFALNGATTSISNFMATSANGTIYCGLRSGTSTLIYTLNPTTKTTTLVGIAKGAALSGMTFDSTSPPKFSASGKKKFSTTKSSVKLKGKAQSLVPLTISTKRASTVAKNGRWSMRVKLKEGKNTFKLLCDDGLGQKKRAKVVVIRS